MLNDCKYGYNAKDNVLRLSLLRSPTSPDPEADQGTHEFTYSLYPHATWKEAMTVRQGYELNYPPLAVPTTRHSGVLAASQSFFGTAEDNIVITPVKKDADDNSLIIRYFEWAGKKGDVHIMFPQRVMAALRDKPDGSCPGSDRGGPDRQGGCDSDEPIRDKDGEGATPSALS